MSDEVEVDVILECDYCECSFKVPRDEIVFEAGSGGGERSMGPEYHYVSEFVTECVKCACDIQVELELWEYPIGSINNTDESARGAEITADYKFIDYESEFADYYSVEGKTSFEIFNESIAAASEMLNTSFSINARKKNLVMLHGYIVSAVEGYLFSTFLTHSLCSEESMRKLVENDKSLANQKISLKKFFSKKDTLKNDLSNHIERIIFHDIEKIRPLYRAVLDVEFGNVKWLTDAVFVRHHCVHRAGYKKDGIEVDLSMESVRKLADESLTFVSGLNDDISNLLNRPN